MQLSFQFEASKKTLLIRRLVRESLDGCDETRSRFSLATSMLRSQRR